MLLGLFCLSSPGKRVGRFLVFHTHTGSTSSGDSKFVAGVEPSDCLADIDSLLTREVLLHTSIPHHMKHTFVCAVDYKYVIICVWVCAHAPMFRAHADTDMENAPRNDIRRFCSGTVCHYTHQTMSSPFLRMPQSGRQWPTEVGLLGF